MKKFIQLLLLAALVTTLGFSVMAQTPTTAGSTAAAGGQDDPETKAKIYDRFTKDRTANPAMAYEAGKEYLAKYEAKDGPEDQYIKYIKKWVLSYEKIARRTLLLENLKQNKINEAFAGSKEVLADTPDDLGLYFDLARAGYIAADKGNEANNVLAIEYGKKSIQLLQSGKSFDGKTPFTEAQKNEHLGNLNFALGVLTTKSSPSEAMNFFLTAAQLDGTNKKNPMTYFYLASVYQNAEYTKSAAEYTANCKTEEQLNSQSCKDLNTKVNQIVDHIIDALARAISFSNTSTESAKFATARANWTELLTTFYKFRNNGSDTGLKELIASITSRPLPKPGEPVMPPIVPQAPTTTPASTGSPTQPSATTSGTTTGKAAASGPAASTAQPKNTSTKTTPKRAHN